MRVVKTVKICIVVDKCFAGISDRQPVVHCFVLSSKKVDAPFDHSLQFVEVI